MATAFDLSEYKKQLDEYKKSMEATGKEHEKNIENANSFLEETRKDYEKSVADARALMQKLIDDAVSSQAAEVPTEVEEETPITPIVFEGEAAKQFVALISGMEDLLIRIKEIIGV